MSKLFTVIKLNFTRSHFKYSQYEFNPLRWFNNNFKLLGYGVSHFSLPDNRYLIKFTKELHFLQPVKGSSISLRNSVRYTEVIEHIGIIGMDA